MNATFAIGVGCRLALSHPTGVCGLKLNVFVLTICPVDVAPHWGAWIEMPCRNDDAPGGTVAPHWGAWIEITLTLWRRGLSARRTPLGCVD